MYAIGIPEDEERYKRAKNVWKLDEWTFLTNNERHQKNTDPRNSEKSKQNKCQKERKKRVNSLYIIVGETTKKIKAKQKITGREKWRNRTQRTNRRNTKLKRKDLYQITIIISKITYLKIPDYLDTLYQNYENQR